VTAMELPKCCGKSMDILLELGRFLEVKCKKCADTVYIKRYSNYKPVMLDD